MNISDFDVPSPTARWRTEDGEFDRDVIRKDARRAGVVLLVLILFVGIVSYVGTDAPPTADAGDDATIDLGDTITLDGSESFDPDGDIESYDWEIVDDAGELSGDGATAELSVSDEDAADSDITVELTVTDDAGNTDTDEVTISVIGDSSNTSDPIAPVAKAVTDTDSTITVGDDVSLDGSESFDADGDIEEYAWRVVEGEGNLTDEGGDRSTLHIPTDVDAPSQYTVELTVTDDDGLADTDSVRFTVSDDGSDDDGSGDGGDNDAGGGNSGDGEGEPSQQHAIVKEHPQYDAQTNTWETSVYIADWRDSDSIRITDGDEEVVVTKEEMESNDTVSSVSTETNTSGGSSLVFYDTMSVTDKMVVVGVDENLSEDDPNYEKPILGWSPMCMEDCGGSHFEDITTVEGDMADIDAPSWSSLGGSTAGILPPTYYSTEVFSESPEWGSVNLSNVEIEFVGDDLDISLEHTGVGGVSMNYHEPVKHGEVTEFRYTAGCERPQSPVCGWAPPSTTFEPTVEYQPPWVSLGDEIAVRPNQSIALVERSGDIDGSNLTYEWEIVEGDGQAELTNETASYPSSMIAVPGIPTEEYSQVADLPTFHAPEDIDSTVNYTVELTVTDDDGLSATRSKTIIVDGTPPVADAGSDIEMSGKGAILNGSASYDDRRLDYDWSVEHPNAGVYRGLFSGMSDSTDNWARGTFFVHEPPEEETTYTAELTVWDDVGNTDTDTVNITVPAHRPPVADAGDDFTLGDTLQRLDGSGSHTNPGSLAYDWVVVGDEDRVKVGSPENFDVPQASPSTRPIYLTEPLDEQTEVTVELTVTDTYGDTDTDTVNVTIPTGADLAQPIADAGGDRLMDDEEPLMLNGSDSYKPGDETNLGIQHHVWEIVEGEGGGFAPEGIHNGRVNVSSPSQLHIGEDAPFVITEPFDGEKEFVVELTVYDYLGQTDTDTMTVTVDGDAPPIADAGDDVVAFETDNVRLGDDSYSIEGTIESYEWEIVEGDGDGAVFEDSDGMWFRAPDNVDNETEYSLELTVTDDNGKTDTDTMNISVGERSPPNADAGQDVSVQRGDTISLIEHSSDDDGHIVNWDWEIVEGVGATIEDNHPVWQFDPSDDAALGSEFTVELTVTDNSGLADTDTKTVRITDNAPAVDAGRDRTTHKGQDIALDDWDMVDDGEIESHNWSVSSGEASLSYDGLQNPTFHAPDGVENGTEYYVELTATGSDGLTGTDSLTVTILEPEPPEADAGEDVYLDNTSVVLNGSDSHAGSTQHTHYNDAMQLSWNILNGEEASFGDIESNESTFYVEGSEEVEFHLREPVHEETTFSVKLTAQSAIGLNDTDVVNVTVPASTAPSADVNGDMVVDEGIGEDSSIKSWTTLNGSDSSDSDGIIKSYEWEIIGDEGASFDNDSSATPTFHAPENVVGDTEITLEYTVTDNHGMTDTETFNVTVLDTNELIPPEADAGEDRVIGDNTTIDLHGVATDEDTDDDWLFLNENWEVVKGEGASLNESYTNATFDAPEVDSTTEFTLEYTVTDNDGLNDTDTVNITVHDVASPESDAGEDTTVQTDDSFYLNGSGVADDGDIVDYWWSNPHDALVVLGSDQADPRVITPDSIPSNTTEYTLELTVTDEFEQTSTDTVTITVENQAPSVDAGGDPTIDATESLSLHDAQGDELDNASASDDGGIESYEWTVTSGNITLSDADSINPTMHAPDTADTATLELTVTDDNGKTTTDTVNVTVLEPNPPEAHAGSDTTIRPGEAVQLNGTPSTDDDGTVESYEWEIVDGEGGHLESADDPQPTFQSDDLENETEFAVELTVTDNNGFTDTDSVNITVAPHQAPTADISGVATINVSESLELDGTSSSDDDGTITSYEWEIFEGDGATLENGSSATPTFHAPESVDCFNTFSVGLEVTDDEGFTDTDTAEIHVDGECPSPGDPTADAGDDVDTYPGSSVDLDGTRSYDGDGEIVSYEWEIVDGDGRADLVNASTDSPTFHAPETVDGVVDFTAQLTVTDDDGNVSTDTVSITVSEASAPVADAGDDFTVEEGENVTLDASASTDADGDITEYEWEWQFPERASHTSSTNQETNSHESLNPVYVVDDTELQVNLTVTDNNGFTDTDSVNITVENTSDKPHQPVADAGDDQTVAAGESIELDGTSSYNLDGEVEDYTWFSEHNDVTLSDEWTATPTLDIPQDIEDGTEFDVSLLAHGYDGLLDEDVVTITVVNEP